jgi:hypothetical protein
MKPASPPQVLFYPFHLCHEDTLAKLLSRFTTVHFRDFMALQFTSMVGMTAFADRMGDSFPELLAAGRLVQGYDVSGPLSSEVGGAIDRDLQDPTWREIFHRSLRTDRRFQRGLFEARHPLPETNTRQEHLSFSVDRVKQLCMNPKPDESELEYALALIKTSASLVYTYRLALAHGLQVGTDSSAHYALFERTRTREHIALADHLIVRKGY